MTPPAARTGSQRPRSVLLAEHEPDVAEMSARYLRRDGLLVRLVTTPEQALAQLTTELTGGQGAASGLDLTVLDLTMPGLDPRRLRRALRTPVIFLAAGPQGPGPRGLARGPAGPRRWLTRPFGPRQLVALARDVLAEAPQAPIGPDQASTGKTAERAGGALRLTPAESAIWAALLAQPGRVLSRRQLLAAAGRQAAGDRAADVYIAQLRAKLEAAGEPGAIRTVRGAGYVVDP
ncbi:MAG TPA: response regulator transcription factor [Streptosporangiaceae bacterium]|nr:response regulator transcription factor [Streptosporangiaceae bacterium]